jgi:DNA-directed RNA polymerase specialized sigma24 family protein
MKSDIDRTERLLALILIEQIKGATQRDKAQKLNLAGFSNLEIADILQMSSFNVAQVLYLARQEASSKKRRGRKAKAGV